MSNPHTHTHTEWKAERQERCNQQNYTKIQSTKKKRRGEINLTRMRRRG